MPEEFRAWPLLRRLHGEGHALAMPVMQGKGQPLVFRAWAPGDAMDKAVWGIAEPKADKPVLEPDIVLVPLLAFDAAGWRLGYGGGYYDRTLRGLRARKTILAVGIAYDESQVDAVPHLDYDERLDWVLRPSGPLKCAVALDQARARCVCCSSATLWAAPAGGPCSTSCRACAGATSSTSSPSTARTRPAASASRRPSWRNCWGPAPTW